VSEPSLKKDVKNGKTKGAPRGVGREKVAGGRKSRGTCAAERVSQGTLAAH